MDTVYPSKIDRWLLVVLVLSYGAGFAACLQALVAPDTPADRWVGAGALVLLLATLLLVFPCRYHLTDTLLLVRCGVLRYRIPLDTIERIRPTRNPLASAALSLDRLQIDYRKGTFSRTVLISPRDREAFLRDLAARAPGLTPDGHGNLTRQVPQPS
ncbi:MAG: hypothetical protein KatS3mg042_1228 [Rhodothermaceae bacterium]|nr:MAG: hypothetical protein KatS3mg042_1228 [Rhodothermaceae bacterium]